jgi:hypothetical protein
MKPDIKIQVYVNFRQVKPMFQICNVLVRIIRSN